MHCAYTSALPRSHGPKQRAPTASRLAKESKILSVAESHFARNGFEGTSLENIAIDVGMSRHNLLYYYPNKEMLYHRLLDGVIHDWLGLMATLAESEDPEQGLRSYIHGKVAYARQKPNSTRILTQEMLAGAPHYSSALKERVAPLLAKVVGRFEDWASEGRIAKLHFTHLMFQIWAMTQSYADQETPFLVLLKKSRLSEKDHAEAEALIVRMVLGALKS